MIFSTHLTFSECPRDTDDSSQHRYGERAEQQTHGFGVRLVAGPEAVELWVAVATVVRERAGPSLL